MLTAVFGIIISVVNIICQKTIKSFGWRSLTKIRKEIVKTSLS
tara:strand:- start:1406 stop:1534 length:129 start_codon:yes stop_codon:yes gene_type:complete